MLHYFKNPIFAFVIIHIPHRFGQGNYGREVHLKDTHCCQSIDETKHSENQGKSDEMWVLCKEGKFGKKKKG